MLGTAPSTTADEMTRWIADPSCLASERELTNLLSFANAMLDLHKSEKEERTRQREDILRGRELRDLTHAELKKYYHGFDHLLTKDDLRGLKELRNRVTLILNAGDPADKQAQARELAEIIAALYNRHRAPFPTQIDLSDFGEAYRKYVNNPIGLGRISATNLNGSSFGSSFWREPDSIASQNLYYGFKRSGLPEISKSICLYAGPKLGYGRNPGFQVTAGGDTYKVKFADVHCEPFAARIFSALGYHADPTDYAPQLRITYDRRILTEFNLRKEMPIQVTAFSAVPLCKVQAQRDHDPFDYIVAAVLKNGSRISAREFKRRLFHRPQQRHPENLPANFKTDFEQQIDYLVTRSASIKTKEPHVRSIGPWDYSQLGHEDFRELRGLGLLAAWLGWFDIRYENTRLKIVKTDKGTELRHYFTDLGGPLGRSKGLFNRHSQDPNAFPWSFTRQARWYEKGNNTNAFRIFGVQPVEETLPFRNMALEDARWMARLISQLTEAQIIQALAASGFDAAEVKLLTEKLVSRRDQMIRDVGLASEIALLRPNGSKRRFNFDPAMDGLMRVQKDDGPVLIVNTNGSRIENGRLVHRSKPGKPNQPQSIASR